MTTLLTADLHFALGHTVEYRLGIVKWLCAMVQKYSVHQIIILGDLTEEKDRHNAYLVDAVTNRIHRLGDLVNVWILRGNHDYLDPDTPFFGFMSKFGGVEFISEIRDETLTIDESRKRVLFLPHTRNPIEDWENIDFDPYAYIFIHQTFTGAKAETGRELRDVNVSIFGSLDAKIYSGDIHVPQSVGIVEYVGAPYRMKFGDAFTPRVLLLKGGRVRSLRFPCPNKHIVEMTTRGRFKFIDGTPKERDFVKLRIHTRAEDYQDWDAIRERALERAEDRGWEISMIEPLVQRETAPKVKERREALMATPEKTLRRFCKARAIDERTAKTGRILLNRFEG